MTNVVTVTVSGPVGSGKLAILGEIEIAMKAIGVPVSYADEKGAQSEKAMTHADWAEALELYKPSVVLVEKVDPLPKKAYLATFIPAVLVPTSREIDQQEATEFHADCMKVRGAPVMIWAVYFNTTDHPDKWIARPFLGDKPIGVHLAADTYEDLRAKRPLTCMFTFDRNPADDPRIVQTWL